MGTPMLAHVAINLRRFSNLRQLPLRELQIVRITVEELKQMIDNAHVAVVVDLRGTLGHQADAYTTPGSLRVTTDELEECHQKIPRHRDVILFCACPNEATAAKMASSLRKNGITRVRPLAGGIDA